jgi:pimeloyl-ACP methyl ester carboxylesterase
MRRSTFLASGAGAAIAVGAIPAPARSPERNVVLTASDGVRVYGIKREPKASAVGIILLFHQASSSAGEYDPIAPRLVDMGFATLAIDQRSGGKLYGPNRTVAELGRSESYLAAERDLDAAAAWAQKTYPRVPVILWGSSYSASLVFVTAANRQGEIAKVLAFSPGEYFEGKLEVAKVAKRVTAPIFVDSAADKEEIDAAKVILAASPSTVKVQYVPAHGVHGSSTLRKDKDPDGYDENWRAVEAFLRRPLA